ncbi:cobalt-precorrin-6A synthase (deacetylating) [Methanobacterium lacus]|uniref:Cobalt-precorrin-5B C(1)-methyltransferase n=1 Tax=Methanobacterium lacus (strain AL-21) TaxID=877455 RepID=F0TAY7_METLA|nr:cobalt-precorrin-5B (C(1))-methyltransferase CbiD [Methanobacterium lacus]ADZ10133.1 cobalt-precorrin-6A synthase (deacetylating) [Methanobacterium lacus]
MENRAILDRYHLKESEYGITTGSAATAAALAALFSLNGEVKEVKINTPLGEVILDVKHSEKLNSCSGRASVVKYPYDDPDVTINLEVVAELILKNEPGITVKGGDGVGTVTKPGLQVPVGCPAINPTPMEMIVSNLESHLPEGKGAEVTIIVPHGKELAKRTLNPRLGVVGGISILGTTGFARSMNLKSYKESYRCQIDVAVAGGYEYLVFVPGNIGEKIAKQLLDIEEDQIVQMGNFVGYMLDEASKKGVKQIMLLGHAGKLIKISAGIFNTKHSVADGRHEIIASHAALQGADQQVVGQLFKSTTTEDMITVLEENGLKTKVFNSIAKKMKQLCSSKFNMDFEVTIVNMEGEILNS